MTLNEQPKSENGLPALCGTADKLQREQNAIPTFAEKDNRPAPEHANDHIHVAGSQNTLTRCALLCALKQTPCGSSQYDGSHPHP